jgi:hypothetical protein
MSSGLPALLARRLRRILETALFRAITTIAATNAYFPMFTNDSDGWGSLTGSLEPGMVMLGEKVKLPISGAMVDILWFPNAVVGVVYFGLVHIVTREPRAIGLVAFIVAVAALCVRWTTEVLLLRCIMCLARTKSALVRPELAFVAIL